MGNKKPQLFDPDDDSGKILLEWWQKLEANRGDRAELCRADNPTEVVFSPAYHRFYQRLHLPDKEALATVAGLCSHVKENRNTKKNTKTNQDHFMGIAEQMAESKSQGDDKKAQVSGLRFRRLLTITNRNELYHAMIRIIRLLNGTVNIYDLAKSMYWWNEHTKKQWAYEYYEHAPKKEK